MSHLAVAVGIADAINRAFDTSTPLDIDAETLALTKELNLPMVTPQLVAEILRSEGRAAGVIVTQVP